MPTFEDGVKAVTEHASNTVQDGISEGSYASTSSFAGVSGQMPRDACPVPFSPISTSQPAHQRLVFTDPVAFRCLTLGSNLHTWIMLKGSRYLEEDPSTIVLERRRELKGYELYIVEQWACSRIHPTFVITTFTGLPQHSVFVGVLSVPTDEDSWSPRLRVYLKAISKFHARKKETPLGTLMVTNLSGFPSALNVIAVPGGDVKSHREEFIVNENLKRLGCSGRAGMTLSSPIGATLAKFLHLYRTSDQIPISRAVIELVRLCQVALTVFTKLAPEYADGLLCDVTEQAINDWWTDIGTDYYNIEPGDGILGPTTVAALLGTLLGARNRLNAYGAPVGKDVFELKCTKRAIAYFQKAQKLPRSRRLDRQTLDRLHRVTSKAANGDGWTMPKAVKSTVAELSGKGGEMMMGMVGGRDRAGIAEIESLDTETFARFASGESCKWLWHGKPRKSNHGDLMSTLTIEDEMVFSGDEHGGYVWASRKRDSIADEMHPYGGQLDHLYMQPIQGSQITIEHSDREPAFRKTVLKSVTGRMNDARSGLGRIKDAVGISGLRGHHHRYSKEGDMALDVGVLGDQSPGNGIGKTGVESVPPSPLHKVQSGEFPERTATSPESRPDFALPDKGTSAAPNRGQSDEASIAVNVDSVSNRTLAPQGQQAGPSVAPKGLSAALKNIKEPQVREGSISSPALREKYYMRDPIENEIRKHSYLFRQEIIHNLRNTRSLSSLPRAINWSNHQHLWPRHLSFSVVDDLSTTGQDEQCSEDDMKLDSKRSLDWERYLFRKTLQMAIQVEDLGGPHARWVQNRLRNVEELDQRASRDHRDLTTVHHQKSEEYNSLHETTTDLIVEETKSLTEALKEIEGLGAKLEYELGALGSKVEDVEDGIADLERQVVEIEARAEELGEARANHDSWFGWMFGVFTWQKR